MLLVECLVVETFHLVTESEFLVQQNDYIFGHTMVELVHVVLEHLFPCVLENMQHFLTAVTIQNQLIGRSSFVVVRTLQGVQVSFHFFDVVITSNKLWL